MGNESSVRWNRKNGHNIPSTTIIDSFIQNQGEVTLVSAVALLGISAVKLLFMADELIVMNTVSNGIDTQRISG